jgi:hypothetical protein
VGGGGGWGWGDGCGGGDGGGGGGGGGWWVMGGGRSSYDGERDGGRVHLLTMLMLQQQGPLLHALWHSTRPHRAYWLRQQHWHGPPHEQHPPSEGLGMRIPHTWQQQAKHIVVSPSAGQRRCQSSIVC